MDRIITPSPELGWTFHQQVRVRVISYRNIFFQNRWRTILEGEWMGCWRPVTDGRWGLFGFDFSSGITGSFKTKEEAEKVGHQWLDEIETYKTPNVLQK